MLDRLSNRAATDAGPTVQSVRLRTALIGPLRLVLGIVWLVAAFAAGAPSKPALLGFGVGAFWMVFLAFNDPRARFRRDPEPRPLPANARVAPAWMHAVSAAFPSTVGISVLAAISLSGRPTLAAVMAGLLAGLGIAALLSLRGVDPALYLDPRRRVVFRK